ncbi:MAG: hypothetical protein CSB24_02355 [Deltaproteobacteria bacterium]|nr:MAG: hypothetical protein CSB24_02355 [Deltaproteobacteria bacterium]
MVIKMNRYLTAVILLMFFILPSCSAKIAQNQPENEAPPPECILVLPTFAPAAESSRAANHQKAGELQSGARFIDSVLGEELGSNQAVKMVNKSQYDASLAEIKGGRFGLLRSLGKSFDCQAALYTTVIRFRQRDGGNYGVNSPASAAFEMKLVDTASGRLLWAGTFNETQQSVLSNLFSLKKAGERGFKWITVEELVRQGIRKKLAGCPYL